MIRPELSLRLPNSPGALAGICRLLSDEHVNIVALSLDSGGRVHLVVDNPVRAIGALTGKHHQVTQQDVLFVPLSNSPGAGAAILATIAAAGVNVNYSYGGGGEGSATGALVIAVDDVMRASAAVGT